MNIVSKLISLLLFISCFSINSSIAQNYTALPFVIDGNVEVEWSNHDAEPIANNNNGIISSGADANGTYKFAWNDTNLYLLVVVNDDVLHSDSEADLWQDDGIEVYFDMGNDKSTTYGADDYQYRFRYNDATIYETKHNNTVAINYKQIATTGSVTYELKFPWSTLGLAAPSNDTYIGFDVHINDDDGGSREGKLAWYATIDDSYKNPSLFGTIKLEGKLSFGKADKPLFSHKRGFYTNPFSLTLTAVDDSTTIFYTLDGSDPRTSTTSLSGNDQVQITIDPTISTNRGGKTPGVVVRAFSSKDGMDYSDVKTHSFIFINSVKTQTEPNGSWPNPGTALEQSIDYDMDANVVNNALYKDDMDDAFMQIPTISIVTEINNLFDVDQGIYMNALEQGSAWERPVSAELINPDGSNGFQINAGLRIRGGYSRKPGNAKHSFRLFFRSEYGESKLKYKLFGSEGTDEFDKIDLRTAQNYSWSKDGSEQNNFLKDVSFRDIQGKMGHPYSRSRYYHLYINGMYWGLYQSEERPEARYAADYMGGDKTDYDVVKPERNLANAAEDLKVVATDGNLDAAQRLWTKVLAGFATNESYFEVQGMNADGSRNTSYERLLDIDNMIDYLQIAYYAGSYDAPLNSWKSNPVRPNNYFSIFNRNNPDGFKWMVHDFEHSMNNIDNHSVETALDEDWLINVELADLNDDFAFFNPIRMHLELLSNDEYKMKFADRAFKNLTDGGNLSPEMIQSIFNTRKAQFDTAIIAESARWGDTKREPARTKADWLNIVDELQTNYIPFRTDIVLQQLKDKNLYPDIDPPVYKSGSTELYAEAFPVNIGDVIEIVNSNGTAGNIYYTIDGSDPRAIGGAISSSALNGSDNINVSITSTTVIKARILDGTTWSAVNEIMFTINDVLSGLRVTEVHYNPLDNATVDGGELEFIELKNTGSSAINLTGVSFTDGIEYTFETVMLEAGGFIVLAGNATAFQAEYGFAPDGEFIGSLKNSGENISIRNSVNSEIIKFTYSDEEPWPVSADGLGNSIVAYIHNPEGNPDLHAYWKASSLIGGSPGMDDPESIIAPVIINEVLSNSEYPYRDAIELYNPADSTINIGNWLITDNKNIPKKWQVPAGTTIPAKSYLTFYEGHYNGSVLEYASDEFGSVFSISSHGESVFVFSADADSNITGISTGVNFAAIEPNVSFGRYENSVGDIHFVSQKALSLNADNSAPEVGPLVFSTIMYHPNAFNYEYLEIKNISENTVNLWAAANPGVTWEISGIDFKFPRNVSLSSNETLFIFESGVAVDDFRSRNSLDGSQQVFVMDGELSNSGESIKLKKPNELYLNNSELVYDYILIEEVNYKDETPWSFNADGNGAALVRTIDSEYGNDPVNWSDGGYMPPSLSADIDGNYLDSIIEITFVDDAVWRDGINQITINTIEASISTYTLDAGRLTFNAELFPALGSYEIGIRSDNYLRAQVVQSIVDPSGPSSSFSQLDTKLKVYPNPSSGEYNISIEDDGINEYSYRVFTMQGQVIIEGMNINSEIRIDLSQYANGLYILLVTHERGTSSTRLVKK